MQSWEVADPEEGRAANENKGHPVKRKHGRQRRAEVHIFHVFLVVVIFCIPYEIDLELNPEGIEDNSYTGLICIK